MRPLRRTCDFDSSKICRLPLYTVFSSTCVRMTETICAWTWKVQHAEDILLIPSFNSLGISSGFLSTLETMGYETPTPIQSASIPHLLEGRDLLGVAQTGTGKTAAFALPLLQRLQEANESVKPASPEPSSWLQHVNLQSKFTRR